MRSSNNKRWALGKWAIIIALVLFVAFLVSVAPIGGASPKPKYCPDTCGPQRWNELQTIPEEFDAKICNYFRGGQWYTKYVHKERNCHLGYYYRLCQDNEYCGQTFVCASLGPYEKAGSTITRCDAWKVSYYSIPGKY